MRLKIYPDKSLVKEMYFKVTTAEIKIIIP
jgi:hypothetical protein